MDSRVHMDIIDIILENRKVSQKKRKIALQEFSEALKNIIPKRMEVRRILEGFEEFFKVSSIHPFFNIA